jgi:hypothetical protein
VLVVCHIGIPPSCAHVCLCSQVSVAPGGVPFAWAGRLRLIPRSHTASWLGHICLWGGKDAYFEEIGTLTLLHQSCGLPFRRSSISTLSSACCLVVVFVLPSGNSSFRSLGAAWRSRNLQLRMGSTRPSSAEQRKADPR